MHYYILPAFEFDVDPVKLGVVGSREVDKIVNST